MAKVKDLGINVIPETMRPQECLPWTVGPVCFPGGITQQAEAAGGAEAAEAYAWTFGTCNQAEAGGAGWSNGCGGHNCFGRTGPCTGATYELTAEAQAEVNPTIITICLNLTNHCTAPFSYCGHYSWCQFGTITNCGIVTTCPIHTICPGGTCPIHSICPGGTCPGGSICTAGTHITITGPGTTPQINPAGGGLTRESIAQLKEQLQQQINALDEHAKTIGPKTAEDIDAREKQLKAELEDLAARRKELKK